MYDGLMGGFKTLQQRHGHPITGLASRDKVVTTFQWGLAPFAEKIDGFCGSDNVKSTMIRRGTSDALQPYANNTSTGMVFASTCLYRH